MKIKRELKSGAIIYHTEYNNFHREDGPAFIGYNGLLFWYDFGIPSNAIGPRSIEPDGFILFGCSEYMEIAGMLRAISSNGTKYFH